MVSFSGVLTIRSVTYLGKIALAITDQEACLATATITNNNDLLGVGGWFGSVSGSRLVAG